MRTVQLQGAYGQEAMTMPMTGNAMSSNTMPSNMTNKKK
jgi:hypothetical protein